MTAVTARGARRRLTGLLVVSIALAVYGCAAQPEAPQFTADAAVLQTGEAIFYQCVACHSVTRGGASLMGPNLWGIFGSKAGTRAGFGYSPALKSSGVVWTRETMDEYLRKPSLFIPDTTMAFVGLARDEDRAALIAYLMRATVD